MLNANSLVTKERLLDGKSFYVKISPPPLLVVGETIRLVV